MDYHKIAGATIEDVRKSHVADLAVQKKYAVRYHQFWMNQEAGAIFCLMEGPDMKTCEMVHRITHGNIACAMTEVEPGYYKALMGDGVESVDGIVLSNGGAVDLGYRSILVTTILPFGKKANAFTAPVHLRNSDATENMVFQQLARFNGRRITTAYDDSLVGVFDDPIKAVKCARAIRDELLHAGIRVRFGLSVDQPVAGGAEFFKNALTLAHRINSIAPENGMLISSLARHLCGNESIDDENTFARALTASDEEFVSNLFEVTEGNLSNDTFAIDDLCRALGRSRAQLYRRIRMLTGGSPHDFLRNIRMNKAVAFLKRKTMNISEIALEVGYKNPSYFARCFAMKFGCTPSQFL